MPIKLTIEMTDEAVEAFARGMGGNAAVNALTAGAPVVESQAKAARAKKADKVEAPAADVGTTPAQAADAKVEAAAAKVEAPAPVVEKKPEVAGPPAKTIQELIAHCNALVAVPGNTKAIVFGWFQTAAEKVTGAKVANPNALPADKAGAVFAEITRLSTPVAVAAPTEAAADLFPG